MAVTETGHAATSALDDLYRRHGGEVYRYAFAVLGNHADAEDITQTTFLNAFRSLEQGVRPRKPSNWLLTIASNAIKQRYRREQARPREVELDREPAGAGSEDEGPTVGELLAALARIPQQQRQAIVLREFEGRSYKEIADILGVSTSALEALLFRARRSLAEELEHQLSCTEAQLAVSRAADGRLGRKERRRLREHLAECPDCARFARLQQRHRRALKGLMLIPIPLSLHFLKGIEGSAAAATLPAAGAGAVTAGAGIGAAGTAGSGLFAGGLAVKAAAVVAAAGVAGGVGVVGATEVDPPRGPKSPSPALVQPGKSSTAPGRDVNNGQANGKADPPGQDRARGGPAPGLTRENPTPSRGSSADAKAKASAREKAGANGRAQGAAKAEQARSSKSQSRKEPGTSAGKGLGRNASSGTQGSAKKSSAAATARENARGSGSG
jgi:RNA polymerase sigma factor (sigma-70 family)